MRPPVVSAVTLLVLLWATLASPAAGPVDVTAIDGSERWAGEVKVDGVVVVGPDGELSIEAGTRVVFVPRDDDGDGIGDSELRIEGRLTVEGTEREPVLFTSGAPQPAAADWKYLMINHAREAVVRHAIFEYAYSGVQVHYTRALFDGIVSRHNVDGFRFSTAPVTLRSSLLFANENGIRFEERGAGAVIEGNRIAANRVGIFAVVKCRGLTSFSGNAVVGSGEYAVKLGQEQVYDLPIQGNWWGTDDPLRITSAFFDGRVESSLGRVLFEPFLTAEPKIQIPDAKSGR